MISKERIINTVTGKPCDKVPFILPFGPWRETRERWEKEGLNKGVWEAAECEPGLIGVPGVNYGYSPAFQWKIIEDRGDTEIIVDGFGITLERSKTHSTIPKFLDWPVKDWDSWKSLKERLNTETPGRIDVDKVLSVKNSEGILQIGCFPFGLFGTLRDMMGVENLMYAFYDEPELIHEIMDYLTDFWIAIYAKICKIIKPNSIHMWEDMSGKQGPLISPAMIREFMLPNYKKIKKFCVENDIPIFSLDTDGRCDEMFDIWVEAGINLVFPFEVAAGSDVVDIKKRYPTEFCVLGGIDKREISKSEYDIDKELERITPAIEAGMYIPALDHLFPPEISYQNFLYYCKQLKHICETVKTKLTIL